MNQRRILYGLTLSSCIVLTLAMTRAPAARAAAPARAAESYEIDPAHSTIIYRSTHLGVSYSFGRFDDIAGTITMDADKPEASRVAVEIKVGSLDSAVSKRDEHLKGPDFFDAKQFPTATFKSTSVKKKDDKHVTVAGDFSLHGVTKPVTIDIEKVGAKSTPMGDRAGFYGELTLKRSDFGIKFMTDMIGDDVLIMLSIEGVKPEAAGGGGKK